LTASVIPFPRCEPRRKPERIEVVREHDGGCWLVLTPRGHGWLHGGLADALKDAASLARNYGCTIAIITELRPEEVAL